MAAEVSAAAGGVELSRATEVGGWLAGVSIAVGAALGAGGAGIEAIVPAAFTSALGVEGATLAVEGAAPAAEGAALTVEGVGLGAGWAIGLGALLVLGAMAGCGELVVAGVERDDDSRLTRADVLVSTVACADAFGAFTRSEAGGDAGARLLVGAGAAATLGSACVTVGAEAFETVVLASATTAGRAAAGAATSLSFKL